MNEHESSPRSSLDAIIDLYKKDVDRSLLRENLKLTPQQRSQRFESFMEQVSQLRIAGDSSLNRS